MRTTPRVDAPDLLAFAKAELPGAQLMALDANPKRAAWWRDMAELLAEVIAMCSPAEEPRS